MTTGLSDLYSKKILALASDIQHTDRVEKPGATVMKRSPLCGSKVTVDLSMKDGVVSAFGHQVEACVLGQAASSVMARNVIGSSPRELRDVAEQMHAMLKEGGTPPVGRWSDLEVLEPVRDYSNRHASVMLTFNAVLAAIDEIEAREPAA